MLNGVNTLFLCFHFFLFMTCYPFNPKLSSLSWNDLRFFLCYLLEVDTSWFLANKEIFLTKAQKDILKQWTQMRLQGMPLSKIVQEKWFYDHPFYVNEDVLDPRFESETMIDAIMSYYKDQNAPLRFLDLGTGSGCLILTLLYLYPNAKGIALDKSEKALLVCKRNRAQLSVHERLSLVCGSWLSSLKGTFDVLLSNPPYIDKTESIESSALYDPQIALFASQGGLGDYMRITEQLCFVKFTHGFFEVGYTQSQKVQAILKKNLCNVLSVHKDLLEHERIICFEENT